MGHNAPMMNRRHVGGGDIDHRLMRDVDHRMPAPPRRDSWEAKCDEFIMNMFEVKPSSTSPPPADGEAADDEASPDKHSKKRKSH